MRAIALVKPLTILLKDSAIGFVFYFNILTTQFIDDGVCHLKFDYLIGWKDKIEFTLTEAHKSGHKFFFEIL